ncbi:hypothetical protein RYH70_05385 [Alloalcanivorax xenomutans]|uniref:hypothetical protein n=1 Tax=Alloalcanivorax xenomutans TaxID=1094342 RepID=UPI0029340FAE|nr:hypothetical protein [Alloalcanivorax xenomutans]WOD29496.1 hypothetical protein RYH70_05385 [Alloalcanivorax xenomutans]
MKYLLPLPALLLAGCQMLSYTAPTDGDVATVTFSSDNIAAQPVVCVPGKGFQSTPTSLQQVPFETKAFDELLKTMKKAPEVTTTVRADEQARIGVIYQKGSAGNRDLCRVAVQFNAQAGASYAARFTNDNNQCGLEVSGEGGLQADAVPVGWKCPKK